MHFSVFYAVRQIIRNKKKCIVLFLAMFISLSLLIDMMGMYRSYKEMMLEDAIENYGAYHLFIKDVTKEECETLKKADDIESIGYEGLIDTVSVGKYDGQNCESDQKVDLFCMDRTGYELNYTRLIFGRLPERDNEIIISAGIELSGDYAFRTDAGGKEISLVNGAGEAYTYTIVGVCDDFNASQGDDSHYKAYTFCEQAADVANAYVTISQGMGYHDVIAKLAETMNITEDRIKWDGNRITDDIDDLGAYRLICNSSLLHQIEDGPSDESSQAVIYIMQIIVIFILIVAAMVIWNIYGILVGGRREEIGLLRVCGVSVGKILLAGLVESGILFGTALLLNTILTGVGEFLIQQLIQFMRITELAELEVKVSYTLILLSAFYVGIIVAVVVILTMVMLMKGVSPVELLNGGKEKEVRRKRKHIDSRHIPSASFLIGRRSLLRNKGKSISIVLALAVVTLFFVTFSSFIEVLGSDEVVNDVTMLTESQYVVFKDGEEALPKEFIDSIPNTTEKYTASSTMAEFNISPRQKNTKFKDHYNDNYSGFTADEIFNREQWLLEVVGINKEEYEKYVEWFDGEELSYEEWVESGKALLSDTIITTDEDGSRVKENLLNIDASGTVMTYNDYDVDYGNGNRQTYQGGEVELCGRAGYKLFCREDNFVYIIILLPEDAVRKQFNAQSQILYINAKRGKETEVGVWLKNHSSYFSSFLDDVKKYAASHDSSMTTKVMLRLAFLFVVVVSMLHIYNVVRGSLNAREKEMAVLMAIGMKRWQIRKSVLWEHALYGIIGGILGAAISAVLLERLLMLLSGATKIRFVLPWDYMWVGFCSAIVVSMAVALYATGNVAKTGIVKEISAND